MHSINIIEKSQVKKMEMIDLWFFLNLHMWSVKLTLAAASDDQIRANYQSFSKFDTWFSDTFWFFDTEHNSKTLLKGLTFVFHYGSNKRLT